MLSKKDSAYLSVARYLATKSSARNTHGAVVVKGGSVLGMGFNRNRNHPQKVSPEHIKTECSWHAEELAIKDAGERIKGSIIYVARVNRHGQDRDSRPCDKCYELIKKSGIKRIIYTTEKEVHVSC
jgi:tRNA(Arg) A34 adenosine deaminase TadA